MRVKDTEKIEAFCRAAEDFANDDSHGYSQYHRWGPDYDCSSMMYECAYIAGIPVSTEDPRYTGAMIEDFGNAGYRVDAFDGNLNDLERGDILLNESAHTGVYLGNGLMAEASIDEDGGIAGNQYGDQTGWEIHICGVYNYPWTHVLTPELWIDIPDPLPGVNMYGIDVSSHDQAPFKEHTEWCYNDSDFVIVKVTQGTWYENPCFDYAYNRAKNDGKLLGIYHYAGDEGAYEEAEYFYNHVSHLIGEFIPVLDWEQFNNEGNWGDTNWCRAFCDRFHELSGVWPMIYTSASQIWQAANCSDVCPLWVAGYPSWTGDNWDPDWDDMPYDISPWSSFAVWQYTSDGGTDRNVAAIDGATWQTLAGGGASPSPAPGPTPDPGNAVCYRVSTDPAGRSWLDEMHDGYDTGGSGDDFAGEYGVAARWLAVKDATYRVYSLANGWLPWVSGYNTRDLEYGCAGDGSPILGVEIQNGDIRYAAHVIGGGWYSDLIGQHDTGGSGDTYAGDLESSIDAIRIRRN